MEGVTKRFGRRTVLDDICFEVGRGETAALLGSNGAGKTTTLRILAGFLAATRGVVRVGGWDVMTHSLEARRRIGYLPENVPLYPDLKVDEFLRFRARLKGVPRDRVSGRVEQVKELCGLQGLGAVLVAFLSRGMWQRVGLADALVNEPDVLLLDEPTLGLDPSERQAVVALLHDLAGRHTLLLSTHQLDEAERLCRRLLLLDRGRLVSRSREEFLAAGRPLAGVVEIELRAPGADPAARLAGIPGVRGVRESGEEPGGWRRLLLEHAPETDIRVAVFQAAAGRGWEVRLLAARPRRLEDAYRDWREGRLRNGEDA
jgi:ABC-2 type transport system ATP-binding protein